MVKLYKKIDSFLIVNKPHIWLTRLHLVTPVSLLVLISLFIISFRLPLPTAIYPILIGTCLVSLVVLLVVMRFQYLYYSKNFSAKQLNKIFLFNLLNIFILLAIAIIVPLQMGNRVQTALDSASFSDVSTNIRIAMIRSDLIAAIKGGVLDSIQKGAPPGPAGYWLPADFEDNMSSNNFILKDLTVLNLNNLETSSTVDSLAVIDSTSVIDTTSVMVDTSKMSTDTSKISTSLTDKAADTTSYLKHYNYSSFLITLRGKTDEEITSIKKNINATLQRYDFSKYDSYDSSFTTINTYYDVLNNESLNLYSTKTFYEKSSVIIMILFVLLISLAQFSIMLFNKNSLIALAIALATFYCIIAIIIWDGVKGPSELLYKMLLTVMTFLIILLYFSKIFENQPGYSRFNIFSFYSLNFLVVYIIVIITIVLYYILVLVISFLFSASEYDYFIERFFSRLNDHEYQVIIVPALIFIFLLIKVYARFLKRIYWINCLPQK